MSATITPSYEAVVLALAASDRVTPHSLDRDRAHLVLSRALGEVHIAVLRHGARGPTELEGIVRELAQRARTAPVDIVLVGGGPDAKALLRRSTPWFSHQRIGLLHLSDGGEVWKAKPSAADGLLLPLDEKLAEVVPSEAAWSALIERARASTERASGDAEELARFGALVSARRPIVTYGLVALIGLIYALELALGGPGSPPVLARMGALIPERVWAGEWWRLVSCTFLHGSHMHAFLNAYVLLLLGTSLERVIGSPRFLVLYTTSALAGSVGSALLLEARMSVGASGAVWGLMGAEFVLAYRRQDLLPAALVPAAKRTALVNLALNVANSFRPNVDLWAHFAGGAAGALLFVSGLLTRGLPRLGEIDPRRPDAAAIPSSAPLRALAGLALAVLLLGPGAALNIGRPLALNAPPDLVPTTLEPLGLRLDLPAGAVERREEQELLFGDLGVDPMMITAWVADLPEMFYGEDADLSGEIDALMGTIEPPEGGKEKSELTRVEVAGDPAIIVSYEYPNGLIFERAFIFRAPKMIRVEVLRWPQHPVSAPAGAALTIASSARVL